MDPTHNQGTSAFSFDGKTYLDHDYASLPKEQYIINEHETSSINNDNESLHDLHESIANLEKKTHESQSAAKNTFVEFSQKLIGVFPFAATFFVQQLTVNDHPDINFISLLLNYLLQLGLIIIIRTWIISHEKQTRSVITFDLYDVLMDTFHFAMILFSIILIRLLSSYFNFTMDDTYTLIIIFALTNLFIRKSIRISTSTKYPIR